MAINKDSNAYTFGFAIAMVVIVGGILSFAAMSLKPYQDKNIENEKKQSILAAIGIETELDGAAAKFEEYVTGGWVLDAEGDIKKEGLEEAFKVDVKKQYKSESDESKRDYPLYQCEVDGQKVYVIPMVGTGLWGPIWGFIALKEDMKTIYGASFDHKTETPGLGAEINKEGFEGQFAGKSVYKGSKVALSVVKAGKASEDNDIDGISGGTITSDGVHEMIQRTMKKYLDVKMASIN